MSYDLMVFEPSVAPVERSAFEAWYRQQTTWSEAHNYNDAARCSPALSVWFAAMIKTFPPLNGPLRVARDDDRSEVTDYSIGSFVIYAGFRSSVAERAYMKVRHEAVGAGVGFFDVSGDGEIWRPQFTIPSGSR